MIFGIEQNSLRTKIGTALRAQQKHWGLSQGRLAQQVGLTTRCTAELERSEFNATLDELVRILGVDPVALLNGELRDQLPKQRDALGTRTREAAGRKGPRSS